MGHCRSSTRPEHAEPRDLPEQGFWGLVGFVSSQLGVCVVVLFAWAVLPSEVGSVPVWCAYAVCGVCPCPDVSRRDKISFRSVMHRAAILAAAIVSSFRRSSAVGLVPRTCGDTVSRVRWGATRALGSPSQTCGHAELSSKHMHIGGCWMRSAQVNRPMICVFMCLSGCPPYALAWPSRWQRCGIGSARVGLFPSAGHCCMPPRGTRRFPSLNRS